MSTERGISKTPEIPQNSLYEAKIGIERCGHFLESRLFTALDPTIGKKVSQLLEKTQKEKEGEVINEQIPQIVKHIRDNIFFSGTEEEREILARIGLISGLIQSEIALKTQIEIAEQLYKNGYRWCARRMIMELTGILIILPRSMKIGVLSPKIIDQILNILDLDRAEAEDPNQEPNIVKAFYAGWLGVKRAIQQSSNDPDKRLFGFEETGKLSDEAYNTITMDVKKLLGSTPDETTKEIHLDKLINQLLSRAGQMDKEENYGNGNRNVLIILAYLYGLLFNTDWGFYGESLKEAEREIKKAICELEEFYEFYKEGGKMKDNQLFENIPSYWSRLMHL